MILGLWMIVSSWWMNLSGNMFWNGVIVGAVVFILGVVREWGDPIKTTWASWLSAVLGVWIIMSSFFFDFGDFSSEAFTNVFTVGVLVLIFAGWSTLGPIGLNEKFIAHH